jgi:hypothetical protein
MLHQFIRPIVEYGLSLVSISPALQSEIIRYDRKTAVLAKRNGQAMLPPTVQTRPETSNSRTAFLAVQYYLNHFPKGFGAARKKLGVDEAEKSFSRLK